MVKRITQMDRQTDGKTHTERWINGGPDKQIERQANEYIAKED